MKQKFLCLLFLLPLFVKAQNLPACDSLVITCCAIDSVAPNTITLYAANPSSELFDYPGFVLLNAAQDTIAKETVNYFGIGTAPQPHTMSVIAPYNLPFTGYLDLYQIFYQSFACSFPITIADTATGVAQLEPNTSITVFPNPFVNELNVDASGTPASEEMFLTIVDVAGKQIYSSTEKSLPATLSLNGIKPGIYLLRITNAKNQLIKFQKVIVQE